MSERHVVISRNFLKNPNSEIVLHKNNFCFDFCSVLIFVFPNLRGVSVTRNLLLNVANFVIYSGNTLLKSFFYVISMKD